ncbi:HET-C domain-containing protein HetC [Coccidioides immitis RS]|uniref:HET-C domain-containing protein HetC n=2 Tax=Coccidioides immitis TaxID=5501 RepID=J3KGQ5_COCIM|nr:HET-C domain-containing protein HetC [Coccidioides immitis RS]EAS34949.3 HET-C domain-containing protein HetC [Coccidioides immitis RS]KMU81767.1 HET-C_domain_containing protein [Coccidioides immitis RMSCC 3703]
MGSYIAGVKPAFLIIAVILVLLPSQVNAFGAGNIASISKIEGKNWRHGDIEDMLKTLAFIKGHKWTSNMVKRVYFGNWLRDYSQAMDVGTLQKLQSETIRVLVWILSFMSFGYATGEFEVTAERLGVYRPEEHIDNPKDYADNKDARQYDARLRGPVRQVELDIDLETGMKNYIANERGDWATSAGYVRYSFARSIHFGRLYTKGGHKKGREEDLYEALRCLGQGLHTLEDFGAHTNYCELVLREMGMYNVFPHTGTKTMMTVRGKHIFPLVTGTFGMVDFFHSVLGEATDHFAQSEIDEADNAFGSAQASGSSAPLNGLTNMLGNVPGMGDLITEAQQLQQQSQAQAQANQQYQSHHGGYGASRGFNDDGHGQGAGYYDDTRAPGQNGANIPGMPDFDPQKTISQIYPILVFRDKVVRRVSSVVEKIPGLESLMEKISETLTVFVYSLLAPFVRPLITFASKKLHLGSSEVINSSAQHQFEPWTDPHCTDPTHSLLSKDHFSNILNEPAGGVAAAILKFVVPRVLYAWQHADFPVDHVLNDCVSVFHHPALRDMNNEAHRTMFEVVQQWAFSRHDRGASLDHILSAESVRAGKNHTVDGSHGHGHGHSHGHGHGHVHAHSQPHQAPPPPYGGHGQPQPTSSFANIPGLSALAGLTGGSQSHQSHSGSSGSSGMPWDKLSSLPILGMSNLNKLSSFIPGGHGKREMPDEPNDGTGQQPPYIGTPAYAQVGEQQQQQQHYSSGTGHDAGFSVPPPAGYEQYHQQRQPGSGDGHGVYQPPTHGAHTYDYYSGYSRG